MLIYGSLAIALWQLSRTPKRLLQGIIAYTLLIWFLMAVMGVTPLDPPPGMITLQDPLIQNSTQGAALTRDLFFSGHTSLLFLLMLLSDTSWLKLRFALSTLCVALFVLSLHVHYTVDVVAAPIFAYAAFALSRVIST